VRIGTFSRSHRANPVWYRGQKTSWADDVEDLGGHFPPFCPFRNHHSRLDQSKGEDYIDENGIRTTVEYTINEEGKKIKVSHGSFCDFVVLLILENRSQER
jgi:hypothetical protein